MSMQTKERIPQLTLGWRLQMSLGEESAQSMADYLGVSRATISRWMHDKGQPPKRAFLAQWALRTGVPLDWLVTGEHSPTPPPSGDSDELDALTRAKARRVGATREIRDTRCYPALVRAA